MGGPLMVQLSGRWFVVGVFEFSVRCVFPDKPDMYTNVVPELDWIQLALSGCGLGAGRGSFNVVGGTVAARGAWPWLAAILRTEDNVGYWISVN